MPSNSLKETKIYTKKIFFFGATHTKLLEAGIKHDVEKKFDGDKKPDFFVYEDIPSALEHKFSLPVNNLHLLQEIKDCYDKYSKIKQEKESCEPEVILLFPKTCLDSFRNVEKQIESDVIIWIFDLNVDEQTLLFKEIYGESKNKKLKDCLLKEVINFKLTQFSKIKFLGDEPPPVYTATALWPIFQSFISPLTKTDSIEVKISDILNITKTFYPHWVLDRHQLTKKRLDKALLFLDKINFVKVQGDIVTVFYRKGRRANDLSEYFSKQWDKIKDSIVKPEENGKQSRLDRWR